MHSQVLESEKKRYHLLDAIRGVLVICMVVHHGLLSIYMATENELFLDIFEALNFLSPYFAGVFILISGICCRFSRSNAKRGAQLFMVACLITVLTVIADAVYGMGISIIFGILHLLAFCMLFVGAFDFALKKINPYIGMAVFGVVSVLYFVIFTGDGLNYFESASPWLFPFGWTAPGFFSADYWPVIPWIFVYLFGYYFGNTGLIEKHPKIFAAKPTRVIPFVGRHALLIYILHQPIIFGVAYLIQEITHG